MLTTDQILAALWRRRISVVLTFVLTLAAVAAVTFALPRVYSATTYLIVSPSSDAGSDFEATQISQVLTRTYAELLQARGVADVVATELSFDTTGVALLDAVEVAPVTDSQLLEITASGSSPERAQEVANTYARVFSERASDLTAAGTSESRVSVAEPAALPVAPTRPQPRLYLLIGAVVALFAAVVVGLLRQRLDQRLDIDSGTREVLGVPVIGRIPEHSADTLREFVEATSGSSSDASGLDEAFRLLLANLTFVGGGTRPRTVALISGSANEGKSTCASALARAATETGLRVLLVDADLRRGNLTQSHNISPLGMRTGLSSFLVRPARLSEATTVVPSQVTHMVPAGPLPPNPAALLSLPALAELDRQARESYDLVIYDTPPLSIGADASLIAAQAEGVILVIHSQSTKRSATLQAVDQLTRARAHVLGVAINGVGKATYDYYSASGAKGRPVEADGRSRQPPEPKLARQASGERR